MKRMSIVLFLLIFIVSGCASVGKSAKSTQLQQLEMEICRLKEELQQRDSEIDFLEEQLEETQKSKVASAKGEKWEEPKINSSKKTAKNIQIALKNARFYYGALDGMVGKETKKAIKEFQKANNLTTDGMVGKETWMKLKKYLQ